MLLTLRILAILLAILSGYWNKIYQYLSRLISSLSDVRMEDYSDEVLHQNILKFINQGFGGGVLYTERNNGLQYAKTLSLDGYFVLYSRVPDNITNFDSWFISQFTHIFWWQTSFPTRLLKKNSNLIVILDNYDHVLNIHKLSEVISNRLAVIHSHNQELYKSIFILSNKKYA